MTREEKDLLLQDLCCRLPYGVIIEHEGNLSRLDTIFMCDSISISSTSLDKKLSYNLSLGEFKPYLFPLSSMTDEERNEYKHFVAFSGNPTGSANFIDWLNSHHFDYRGLIPKGLALDATGLNIY